MKNVHVLPTEKPSRLMIDTIENKLYLQPILHEKTINVLPQHIYITSDEEIKEGDWYYLPRINSVYKCVEDPTELNLERIVGIAKIILTTDPELITDGVQAIDDNFLEWFVKNPSCENVEVEHFGTCCGNQSITQCINCEKYNPIYKITIPQEEPKQETLNKINNMNEEIKKQINLLQEEQTRVKQFINENNFNCTTAPYVIAKQYRDEIKKHIGILKMNLEK
jgi:hypothetical protein